MGEYLYHRTRSNKVKAHSSSYYFNGLQLAKIKKSIPDMSLL